MRKILSVIFVIISNGFITVLGKMQHSAFGDTYKNEYVDAFLNLKNKEGKYPNKDVQLIIIRTLNPAWVNNTPLFSINDSSLFDEIINIELDKEVFKELYLGEIESRIHKIEEKIENSDSAADIENFESWMNEEKGRYDFETKYVHLAEQYSYNLSVVGYIVRY